MKRNSGFKISAVEDYLRGSTLSKTAIKFNVHPVTLCRWVQWYKNIDKNFYHKPWNRMDEKIEEKIMLIKENNPAITLNKAQELLRKQGIVASAKGIYNVWLRYNLAGRPATDPFSHFAPLTPEIRDTMECVRLLMRKGKDEATLRKAARILNDLPSYPFNYEDLIRQVPEKFLSLRRKFDRLYTLFLTIPLSEFYRKIRKIRIAFEGKGLRYSSIIAGLSEIIALQWMDMPKEELRLNARLSRTKGRLRDPVLNFQLNFLAAMAWSELMELKKAWHHAKKARRLLKTVPLPVFFKCYGDLMTYLGDYSTAFQYHLQAYESGNDKDTNARLSYQIALDLTIAGAHRKALKFANKKPLSSDDKNFESYASTLALANLGLAKLDEASSFIKKALEKARKERFRNRVFSSACCLAAIARILGKKEESDYILGKYLELMKKYRLKREALIMKFLLGETLVKRETTMLPTVHILYLLQQARQSLKKSDYERVIIYARKYGLMGYFHRCLIFLPELVLKFLEMGKDFCLPAGMLKLPVFNKNVPVYRLQFLGRMRIFKNQKFIKAKFNPKEKAFLTHFALNAGEPEKSISIKNILQNFWPNSVYPASRLAHFLVHIKKKLMIPSHLINTQSSYYGDRKLINKGLYMTTDYNDFQSHVAQAKALERIGEVKLAIKDYLRAFRLFRGEPFKKIYDQWSEDMRHEILGQLEGETLDFAKICLRHGNKKDAMQVLEKVLKIISYSEEIKAKIAELCS
jgi:tetratricopeptide (TPR) repeat protein